MRQLLIVFLALCLFSGSAVAQEATAANARELPAGVIVPAAAVAGANFDVDKATEAYIELLTPEQRTARAIRCLFRGWLLAAAVGIPVRLLVCTVFIATGLSQKRDIAKRVSHRPWLYTAIYAALWLVAGTLLGLPLSLYADYYREHAYGLSNLSLGGWFAESGKSLLVGLIILPWIISGLFAAVRKAGERWWLGAGLGGFVVILMLGMIAPVFISPLFNDYKLSANVSGFAGTTQVSLNDNLLNKTSLPEIKAVMGHEMGHYVLNHSLRLTVYLSILIIFGFWFVHTVLDKAIVRFGHRHGITERTDPAVLPIAVAVFSLFFLLLTPVTNSMTRQAEKEADLYGLNAAREPHGFATTAMRLSSYRKIHPGYWEEVFFYDHPSGYDRVHSAMLWLQENQSLEGDQSP
ncbi:MAG: M48 family metalloprotease [Rhodanobacteraceae bacterium]|nr:M48 family metalloprotease [Rhodanobacteraceae bacterium]